MARNAVHSNGSFADGLRRELLAATHDRYLRRGRKATHNYPRKKREQPPGPPNLQPATPRQVRLAATLREKLNLAA